MSAYEYISTAIRSAAAGSTSILQEHLFALHVWCSFLRFHANYDVFHLNIKCRSSVSMGSGLCSAVATLELCKQQTAAAATEANAYACVWKKPAFYICADTYEHNGDCS